VLHKKKKSAFTAVHIAHRGGSAEGYENTIRSFQNALNSGTHMLELDVRLTKDKKVVVFHDQDLVRMAGIAAKISEFEYAKLPRLAQTVPIDTIPGSTFTDLTWSEEDRRIPLLHQVLTQFPRVPMNIDIKDSSEELISQVAQLIKRFEREDITVWGSFDDQVCQKCYQASPETCLFFSAKRACVLILCSIFGLLPFIPIKETHYEVFFPLALKRRFLKQGRPLNFREKAFLWFGSTFLVWKPMISHLRKRGIHVYYWVCNEEDEFRLCLSLGASGIMTDWPTKLKRFLDKEDNQGQTRVGESSGDGPPTLDYNQ